MDGSTDRLLAHHRASLETGSGIAERVIRERGYRSLTLYDMQQRVAREELTQTYSDAGGWLEIPVYRPDGSHFGGIIRLDRPLIKEDTEQKYIWPLGAHNVLDVHPIVLKEEWHRDVEVPLIITEGIKKADAILTHVLQNGIKACVVAVNGCWGWRAKVEGKGSIALPDWQDIALDGREIVVTPDSDFSTNLSVADGWTTCARYMVGKTRAKDHKVTVVALPGKGLKKQGADDYLLDHSLDDMLGLARHPKAIDLDPIIRELPAKSLQMLWDSSDKQVEWVVNRLIGPKSIALFSGHSRSLKTWHVQSLALDMCLGQTWMGHDLFYMTEPVKVLYIMEEMTGEDTGDRLQKLMLGERYNTPEKHKLIHDHLTVLARSGFTIGDDSYKESLIMLIQSSGIRHIFIDSLSMTWDGEENSSAEVKAAYRWLRDLIEQTGVSITLIHHLSKPVTANADRDALFDIRGSGQLVAQADTVVMFGNYSTFDVRNRQVQIKHLKSWKGSEPESWISRFFEQDEAGLTRQTDYGPRDFHAIDLTFDSLFTDNAAAAYATTHDDDAGMEWFMETVERQPGFSTTGIEQNTLIASAISYWPKSIGRQPTETRLADWSRTLVRANRLARFRRGTDTFLAAPWAAVLADMGVTAAEDTDDGE